MANEEVLYNMIFKRKSFHLFRNIGNESISDAELEEIKAEYEKFTPLYPDIKTKIKIITAKNIAKSRGQEFFILMYSEKKENYLQNVGYLGEQLDLFLVSKNIGTLWFGIGKTDETMLDGLDFVIMIAIAKVDSDDKFRKDMYKSKRKPIEEIWHGDVIDGVSDIVRFSPSACNSQPWVVEKDGEKLQVFRYKKPGKRGIMPAGKVSYYNRIDIGIFLRILELCLIHNNVEFDRELFVDNGGDDEKTLTAVYKFGYNSRQIG